MRDTIKCIIGAVLLACPVGDTLADQTFRLYEGVTLYVNNPDGVEFNLRLAVRDINLMANGPREVLFKVYDPEGQPVVREYIPDDGVSSINFLDRWGGFDHEMQYYANLYVKGTNPGFRWSAWSEPERLNTFVARNFDRVVKGGKKGVYRIVLAGSIDHFVTVGLTPDLKYGVAGHTMFIHGRGSMLKKSYVYVPKDTTGIFVVITEPDQPQSRRFKITAPDGKVLLDAVPEGGYLAGGQTSKDGTIAFAKPGEYDGKLLIVEVGDGPNDYLLKITHQQPKTGVFKEYVGMGSMAVYAPDIDTAMAVKGGTFVEDDLVFWHPFQARFHRWLKAHPLNGDGKEKAFRTELEGLFNSFRLLETSDGRGSASWVNWGYAFGYYGCRIWRPSWLLMARTDVPEDLKTIIREGLIVAGDRLSIAAGMERVNGNSFSQINVALWYGHRATGDALQKERFEIFWKRWVSGEGWGPGSGLSRSGDSQEHFSHDMHYGSYIMDNWRGGTWVENGILDDAKDDPRFKNVIERYRELYSYLFCREQGGAIVAANPWSSRTYMSPHVGSKNWEMGSHTWKGEPGPDLTVNVNGGDEWFAARRKNYYMLTFHGRLAPEWLGAAFGGQLGFSGGVMCQLTVPGKGPVLASTLFGSYGEKMQPANWEKYHIHSLVGELFDGTPLVAGISEHDNAKLSGTTVTSSGEVRNGHVRVTRSYTYNADSIECAVSLAPSNYRKVLGIWSHPHAWSDVRVAYEMIPFMKDATVTLFDDKGAALGDATTNAILAQRIRIERKGFGVVVELPKPMRVHRGQTNTAMIRLTDEKLPQTPAEKIALTYRLVPFGN